MEVPDFVNMAPQERLRFWADLEAAQTLARAEMIQQQATMESQALKLAVQWCEVRNGTFVWTGGPTEVVMAQKPVFEEDDADFDDDFDEADEDLDDDEAGADDLWPVNIESTLLAKIRAQQIDLEEALNEHAEACRMRGGPVNATVAGYPDTMFVVFSAQDPLLGIDGTFVFPVMRDR